MGTKVKQTRGGQGERVIKMLHLRLVNEQSVQQGVCVYVRERERENEERGKFTLRIDS